MFAFALLLELHDAGGGIPAPGPKQTQPRRLEKEKALLALVRQPQALDHVEQRRGDVAPALGRIPAQGIAQGLDHAHPGEFRVVGQGRIGLQPLEGNPGQAPGRLDRHDLQAGMGAELGLEVGMKQDFQGFRRDHMLAREFHGQCQGRLELGAHE